MQLVFPDVEDTTPPRQFLLRVTEAGINSVSGTGRQFFGGRPVPLTKLSKARDIQTP